MTTPPSGARRAAVSRRVYCAVSVNKIILLKYHNENVKLKKFRLVISFRADLFEFGMSCQIEGFLFFFQKACKYITFLALIIYRLDQYL